MTDARFPERWLNDWRLQSVTPAAYRLFGNALMWAVSNRTDGRIASTALALIPKAAKEGAAELESVGLWLGDGEDGWLIDGFEDTQTTSADLDVLANARRRQRDKMRRRRAAAAGAVPGHVPGHGSGHNTRPGQARPGQAPKGSELQETCAEPACPNLARRGCCTCWDHAHLEAGW